jgi:hypothetical protein
LKDKGYYEDKRETRGRGKDRDSDKDRDRDREKGKSRTGIFRKGEGRARGSIWELNEIKGEGKAKDLRTRRMNERERTQESKRMKALEFLFQHKPNAAKGAMGRGREGDTMINIEQKRRRAEALRQRLRLLEADIELDARYCRLKDK